MTTIAIIGGTGFTGSNVAREAVRRGDQVVSFSRSAPDKPVDGVRYEYGSGAEGTRVVPGADVVVAALSPRGDSQGTLLDTYRQLADAAVAADARLIVVGGYSSLRPAPGAPRFAEGELPDQIRPEATEMESIRAWLATEAPAALDWTFISPAGTYGAWEPGTRTGSYRVGGDVRLVDAEGNSAISGEDFALAIVDEIHQPAHRREHISVAH